MDVSKTPIIRLSLDDNVAVALDALAPDTEIAPEKIVVKNNIPAGHKIAIKDIPVGKYLRKYGQIIGAASKDIAAGEHVHTHNVEMSDFNRDYAIGKDVKLTETIAEADRATFDGIVRENGQVATRNFIGVLPTVACSASVGQYIADALSEEILESYPNVDGIVGLTQTSGCGLAPNGEGFENLQRSLAGYAKHSNFWGVLMVGLGCEVNQIDSLLKNTLLEPSFRLQTLNIQETGGTRSTVSRGIEMIKKMLPEANQVARQPVPASHLMVGLECGGSDAYSGITANPALGYAADLIVRNGGTAILSETTEIYGAEHLLTRRAASQNVAQKLVELIQWWEDYTRKQGATINNNPTPGNKAGGLTTILEKSLGAVAKGGSTNLMEVYRYAEPVGQKGLVFMDTPGYDLPSITGMIAGGANMICFTTGCGSVLGCKPTPVIKLASNTAMFSRLEEDMDINCGEIAEGQKTVAQMGEEIFHIILDTASGKKTKSESFGYGSNEFVPWQIGAVV
jgi:altronate hydrolase